MGKTAWCSMLLACCSVLHSRLFDMQFDYFQKKEKVPFDPVSGAGVSKGRLFAQISFYATFPLI